jgi:hypothetical protein
VKAVACAASQLSTTRLIVAVLPRSTCSHCGTLNALDQRVPALPSTAADAGVPAFSVEEAVAVRPCEISGSAAAAVTVVATSRPASSASTAPPNAARRHRRPGRTRLIWISFTWDGT